MLLLLQRLEVAASFDSAVHRVHAAAYFIFVSADGIKSFLLAVQVAFLLIMFLLVMFSFLLTEIESADCAGEKKKVKKPSQTSRGVPVGPKIGFKPQQEYQPVPKNPTANSRDNKKKGVEPTIKWILFMNVDNSSSSTTPIIDKIGKFEELLTSGQAIFVDKAGNPLKKVEFLGEYDSEDEVASVDNDFARSMAYERVGFGTQSLLE
ncbi:hypothetical protein Tco_1152146 [Tanacetum coccineum]